MERLYPSASLNRLNNIRRDQLFQGRRMRGNSLECAAEGTYDLFGDTVTELSVPWLSCVDHKYRV